MQSSHRSGSRNEKPSSGTVFPLGFRLPFSPYRERLLPVSTQRDFAATSYDSVVVCALVYLSGILSLTALAFRQVF